MEREAEILDIDMFPKGFSSRITPYISLNCKIKARFNCWKKYQESPLRKNRKIMLKCLDIRWSCCKKLTKCPWGYKISTSLFFANVQIKIVNHLIIKLFPIDWYTPTKKTLTFSNLTLYWGSKQFQYNYEKFYTLFSSLSFTFPPCHTIIECLLMR